MSYSGPGGASAPPPKVAVSNQVPVYLATGRLSEMVLETESACDEVTGATALPPFLHALKNAMIITTDKKSNFIHTYFAYKINDA